MCWKMYTLQFMEMYRRYTGCINHFYPDFLGELRVIINYWSSRNYAYSSIAPV